MTTVRFFRTKPTPEGESLPVGGTLRFTPTRKRVVEHVEGPAETILPIGFTAQVPSDTGRLDVDLAPTEPGWVWEIYSYGFGVTSTFEYVIVPDQTEPIDEDKLVRVSKDTLDPEREPDPAWWAELESAKALGSQVQQAKTHAVVAASDAGAARDQAQSAQAAAKQAAETIGGSVSGAQQAAQDAAQAKAGAVTAANTATQAATEAAQAADTATSVAGIAGNLSDRLTGVEAVAGLTAEAPIDGQTANLIQQPDTLTKAALSAAIVDGTTQKMVHGGQVPSPVRAPVLTVERSWPDRNVDYRVLWAGPGAQELYANGLDNSIRKSIDGGRTWTKKGYQGFGSGGAGCFLKTPTGTLLTMRPASPASIMRSTDDGMTWTSVFTGRPGTAAMGAQSWCVDHSTGYLYYGEYTTADNDATINVYRSTDDGATWGIFHAFPGPSSGSAEKVRHVHSVQWDSVAQRVVIMTGDSEPAAGMYRVTADGAGVEVLLLNRDVPGIPDAGRAIGIIPFPDYLCWTGDSTGNPYLMRVARTEIGKDRPSVERLYRLNSTGWFTCQASDDGKRWVFSASQETAATLDTSVHLYAVEDQGDTIYEVGALPVGPHGLAALAPAGLPENGRDLFVLQGHNVGYRLPVWAMRLGYGVTRIDWPQERPKVYGWQTFNSGSVEVPAAGNVVFGHVKVPALLPVLHIFDAGVVGQSGTVSSARVHVRKKGTSPSFYQAANVSERYSSRGETGGAISTHTLANGDELEFLIVSGGSGAGPFTGTAYVTFGFGRD